MKILIIIISFLFIESCSVARYVAADPYGERLYLWENSSHIDFVRYGTTNEKRLNDFRSCKRDVVLIHGNVINRSDYLIECMVAIGYTPQGKAKMHWDDLKKYFG